ncbi:matrixin family metalloprotease [Geodermatophilus chilensis]|uniref:matrixin family metalloprotease n=1 Tax=Geodermatophilus chilensis TaxID=2035835 RepID=UPI000C2692B5|nr:matrixin family metalloprotease [Geodermatophilus chilensis]
MHEQGPGAPDPGLRRSPSGRTPQWVVDEALGLPVAAVPWRTPEPPARRRRGRGLLAVVLVVGGSLGAAFLTGTVPWPWESSRVVGAPPDPGPDRSVPSTAAAPTDRPTPGAGSRPAPWGQLPPAPAAGGAHAFALTQADGVTPVTYDPCRVVHYALRPGGSPEGGEELVHAAVARVSQVTGLVFVYDGPTDEAPSAEREAFQPDRYGDRWAPVLVAWQTEEENPALAGDTVGQAGSLAVSLGDGPRVYVTGTVSLDADQFREITADSPATASGIVLHELAHLVGLDHVDDDSQLLYPETVRGVTDYAAGDLTGLARLGQGPCLPEL